MPELTLNVLFAVFCAFCAIYGAYRGLDKAIDWGIDKILTDD